MNTIEIPVLLLTGYLGSGKTTLVNHILSNKRGIKFAVIVNDIGEVNIDADLIQKGGVVGKKDDSLVALQNGCICCTLKTDLIEQMFEIMKMQRFDYIVIEASGICEPEPIAQTLCSIPHMGGAYTKYGICRLDCITTVVDALRLQSEFSCGDDLTRKGIDEEDIENLIIQQIEFCNIILLNKAAEVQPEELKRIRQIIHTLQPGAQIIECNYADVDLDKIIHTHLFNFERAATSAGWIRGIEQQVSEEEEKEAHYHHEEGHHHHHHHHDESHDEHEHHDHDNDEDGLDHSHCDHEHGHCCHHDHDHEDGEEEYGIGSFVYHRIRPFNQDKLQQFVENWPKSVVRAKGVLWFDDKREDVYVFEQAGVQITATEQGKWLAAFPKKQQKLYLAEYPDMAEKWDEKYGDREIKLVFIGQHMDRHAIVDALDECLSD